MLRIFLAILLLAPYVLFANSLTKLDENEFAIAEYYLFDIRDDNAKVASSIDAYLYKGETYIAVRPLLEALKLKYFLGENELKLEFGSDEFSIELLQGSLGQTTYWFNDGFYTFVPISEFERMFGSKATTNISALAINFSGHTTNFPYKKINTNLRQRQLNRYISADTEIDTTKKNIQITVPDVYRLYTTPNGYASLNYSSNGEGDSLTGVVQSISDFAYHSASLTLTKNDDEILSNVRLARLPEYPGDKIWGIWDMYTVGDIFSQSASLNNDQSRGLGVTFSANTEGGAVENFRTSFVQYGKPNWEVDIFHNGRFLESRTIPEDGVIEINDIEVYFGQNRFKFVMYGPYGEVEELLEEINVRSVPLQQGQVSHGFSLLEYESSLFDINADEFDIDGATAHFSIGVLDNWNVGIRGSWSDIHSENGSKGRLNLSNKVSLPGWYLDNNIRLGEGQVQQNTSLATSLSYQDSLVLNFESTYLDSDEVGEETQTLGLNYSKRFRNYSNNLAFSSRDTGDTSRQNLSYTLSRFGRYFNLTNKVDYSVSDEQETLQGRTVVSTRLGSNYRVNIQVPYDLLEQEVQEKQISTSLGYYTSNESSRHNLNIASRPFEENISWNVNYNYSYALPTHQLTFGAQYDSNDSWRLRLGVVFGFGFDYYNNQFMFTRDNIHGGGTIDVHTYIDRRLNGVPDNLDYDLEGVQFAGAEPWLPVITDKQGRARLFGARTGVTTVSSLWEYDGETLNQDYVVYSHPGSQHYLNMPYYLTTEIEFFVLLNSNNAVTPLSSVPITAENLSTGDVYQVESDIDGYVNLNNIMPGQYKVTAGEEWQSNRGYINTYKSFVFTTPLEGGFVVLPDMHLLVQGDDGKDIKENLEIELSEDNFLANDFGGNDKLVHLPPEGAVQAPHSLEYLDKALFKKVKRTISEDKKNKLRKRIENLKASTYTNAQGLRITGVTIAGSTSTQISKVYKVLLGAFETLDSALLFSKESTVGSKIKQGIDATGNLIYRVVMAPSFNSQSTAEIYVLENYTSIDYVIEEVDELPSLESGWVVQYSASQDYEKALEQVGDFADVIHLNLATKLVNGDTWYCLISRTFFDKDAAINYLATAKEDGFVLQAQNYLDIIWSKQ